MSPESGGPRRLSCRSVPPDRPVADTVAALGFRVMLVVRRRPGQTDRGSPHHTNVVQGLRVDHAMISICFIRTKLYACTRLWLTGERGSPSVSCGF